MSRIKIVSNGTPQGTFVYGEDGKPITGIRQVNIDIDAGGEALAFLVFSNPEIEVVAENFIPEKLFT